MHFANGCLKGTQYGGFSSPLPFFYWLFFVKKVEYVRKYVLKKPNQPTMNLFALSVQSGGFSRLRSVNFFSEKNVDCE
jgi:hypothetical protein